MSYVDLKHLLAGLALEAVRAPEQARWAPVTAAYGSLADTAVPAVPWERLHERAAQLAQRFGWRPDRTDAAFLIHRGLLEENGTALTALPRFVPHLPYLARQAPRLLDALWILRPDGRRDMPDLERGAALFNAALFFECHELLEDVWRVTTGPARDLYHGIVQVAAAFYHYEKHNLRGARTLLDKGLRKLGAYPDEYLAIRLETFRTALRPWIGALEAGRVPNAGEYPKIRLAANEAGRRP